MEDHQNQVEANQEQEPAIATPSQPTLEDFQRLKQNFEGLQQELSSYKNQAQIYRAANSAGVNPEVLEVLAKGKQVEATPQGLKIDGEKLESYAEKHWGQFETSLFPQRGYLASLPGGSPMGKAPKQKSAAEKYIERVYGDVHKRVGY